MAEDPHPWEAGRSRNCGLLGRIELGQAWWLPVDRGMNTFFFSLVSSRTHSSHSTQCIAFPNLSNSTPHPKICSSFLRGLVVVSQTCSSLVQYIILGSVTEDRTI